MSNTSFSCDLAEKSIYGIILLIQGYLQGRMVISKVKNVKI